VTRAVTFLVVALALGCGATSRSADKPLRSPSMDYPPVPAQTTADGDTLGANRQDLGDALETGPSVETGTKLGEQRYNAPGWVIEDGKPKYKAEKRGDKNTSSGAASETRSEDRQEIR
jgi:hypothetical protein